MKLSFVEALDFTAAVYDYFATDAEFAAFQDAMLSNPERGDVMTGCGGLRKTRWRDSRRGKGSRGGLRIIYLYVPEVEKVLLLDVYDKDETTDLTSSEKRLLASLAQAYREEVRGSTSLRVRKKTMTTERARLFDRLKKGLEDGIAHEKGSHVLRVTELIVPDPPEPYLADDVRRIRTQLRMSQTIFARLLQVSSRTVQSWEQGVRRPQQSSARLLQIIEHPDLLNALPRVK